MIRFGFEGPTGDKLICMRIRKYDVQGSYRCKGLQVVASGLILVMRSFGLYTGSQDLSDPA